MRRALLRLLSTIRPARAEEDLAREVASHLAMLEDDFRRRGRSADVRGRRRGWRSAARC
jgi:hypothetical protein